MTTLALNERPTPAPQDAANRDSARLVLLLDAEPHHPTTLDGAWWPQSTNLATALPALMTAFGRSGVRITRVSYHPLLWDPAPRKMRVGGRTVRLGWFRSIDPHLVSLTGSNGERIELLIVPPDTAPVTAARAMARAVTRRNRASPTAVLAAAQDSGVRSGTAHIPAPRTAAASAAATDEPEVSDAADWESEGGAGASRDGMPCISADPG